MNCRFLIQCSFFLDKIDFRLAANPYEAKYGTDSWYAQIRSSTLLSSFVCISKMVEHIVVETAQIYKGTKNKDNWMFYHDALSLMTAKETIKWMKEKDYLKRWILPVGGLHLWDKDLNSYFGRPIGNSPENMPLDTSLNNNIHQKVEEHVLMTLDMNINDDKKFDLSTPAKGWWAYKRVLETCPTSIRNLQDVQKVLRSLEIVRKAKGVRCGGVGNTNYGRRREVVLVKQCGGKNPRKQPLDDYGASRNLHPHAESAAKMKVESSLKRASGKKVALGNKKKKLDDVSNDDIID